MLGKSIAILTSVKTSVVVFIIAVGLFLAGTLSVPLQTKEFSDITDTVLFEWLGGKPLSVTWWIYALMALLGFMALNLIVCAADSLIRKLPARRLIPVLSPQIVHLGIILILLGHLLTSASGMRRELHLPEGGSAMLTDGVGVKVERVIIRQTDRTDLYWEVHGSWTGKGGGIVKPISLAASAPAYYKGIWLFIKSASPSPTGGNGPIGDSGKMTATLMAHRDPGVIWAFAGGAVFLLGSVLFLFGRPFGETAPVGRP